MQNNYWQEYWENYYKFMAMYIRELQNIDPNVDIKKEYTEVASLFEPSIPNEYYDNDEDYSDEEYSYIEDDRDPPFTFPGGVIIPNPFNPPKPPPMPPNQPPTPFISPGGGQFTINNCKKKAIVRIVMKGGFNPSEFYLIVDSADNRSIQGYRIACQQGRIRFIPTSVDYRNINFIECAF